VLLRVEDAPAALESVRELLAEDPVRARVAVGDVDAGDLVVVLVGGGPKPPLSASSVADGSRPSASQRSDWLAGSE